MWIGLIVIALVMLVAAWEIFIAEGAHLGRRFVVWLYDLSATRYDGIKGFDPDWELRTLGEPLASTAPAIAWARFLDVGAGTGRVARTLHRAANFRGTIINVDASRKMIALGRHHVRSARSHWVRAWGDPLPFGEDSFDLVTCIEVLEFTPDPEASLKELVRVLRRGGWLVITNRVGRQAKLIFGRTFERSQFPQALERAGLGDVETYAWQVEYDLVWARKL